MGLSREEGDSKIVNISVRTTEKSARDETESVKWVTHNGVITKKEQRSVGVEKSSLIAKDEIECRQRLSPKSSEAENLEKRKLKEREGSYHRRGGGGAGRGREERKWKQSCRPMKKKFDAKWGKKSVQLGRKKDQEASQSERVGNGGEGDTKDGLL